MDAESQKPDIAATIRILTPLVRILLRNGVTAGMLTSIVRQVYVQVAGKEFQIPGKQQTLTRIATLTGLSRKEVGKINENINSMDHFSIKRTNRSTRVINHWTKEPEYLNKRGLPASLPYSGGDVNFMQLVKESGADVPPSAILEELINSGMAKKQKDGKIVLIKTMYVPKNDDQEMIMQLGLHVSDLIFSIDHNITSESDDAFFQRKAVFSNVPEDELDGLKQDIFKTAEKSIIEIAKRMAKSDRDRNSELKGEGRKNVGFSMYYYDKDYEDSESSDV